MSTYKKAAGLLVASVLAVHVFCSISLAQQSCTTVCRCTLAIPQDADSSKEFQQIVTRIVQSPEGPRKVKEVVMVSAIWPIGQKIVVEFLDEKNNVVAHNTVKKYARQWEECSNIAFVFVPPSSTPQQIGFSKSHIRISFHEDGYHVVGGGLGKLVQNIPQNQYTMSLEEIYSKSEQEQRRICLHEFGHALGFQHEHLSPANTIQWKQPDALNYWMQSTNWPKLKVEHNIFRSLSEADHIVGMYDPLSIMHYSYPAHITLNDQEGKNNTVLSERDKQAITTIYPPTYSAKMGASFKVLPGNGVRVFSVDNDSPLLSCRKAGVDHHKFEAESGDVLLSLNGSLITNMSEFEAAENLLAADTHFQLQLTNKKNGKVNRFTAITR